jgi:hypothetical protein
MAQLQQPFNANAIDPDQGSGFRQLPAGTHQVVIVASEIKATKANDGGMVAFELEVIDGPARGAGGMWNVNLYSASDKARAIAEAQFSALCHATGQFLVNHTEELHGKPFAVVVTEQQLTPEQKVRQADGQTVKPFTQVSRILRADGSEVKGGGSAPQVQQQAPQQYAQQPAAPVQPQQPPAAWGGAPAQAQPTANGWGGAAPAQQPAQAPAPAAGWQQGAPAGNRPAWGAK